jgi:membrane-associated protease RseP (regulator of RpoE activity)
MKMQFIFRLLPGALAAAVSVLGSGSTVVAYAAKPAPVHESAIAPVDGVTESDRVKEFALAVAASEDERPDPDAPGKDEKRERIIIKSIEPSSDTVGSDREMPWLGVSTEETSEALAAQLGLEKGAGLTVNFVAPESPAAKAGLKKNDVLVQFEEQLLVHPAQLRKLVRSRKEGDTVHLTYYRGGKKQTASLTIGKTKPAFGFDGEGEWEGKLRELKRQLKDLPIQPTIEKHMQTLRESMGNLKVDGEKAQDALKRSLLEAQKELQRALSQLPNTTEALEPARKALKEIQESRILKDNNASMTIRSSGGSVKSLVRSDDSGTLVIVANPHPRLTAHNKSGKLIFDGEIQTAEQRDKVPRDLWERVEPLLEKMNSTPESEE